MRKSIKMLTGRFICELTKAGFQNRIIIEMKRD